MRKAASPETEPNLYALPFLPPNSDSAGIKNSDCLPPVCGGGTSLRGSEASLQGLRPRALSLVPVQSVLSATSQLSIGRSNERFATLMDYHAYQTIHGARMVPPLSGMTGSSRNAVLVSALAARVYGNRTGTLTKDRGKDKR
jgi:hypothetical protein